MCTESLHGRLTVDIGKKKFRKFHVAAETRRAAATVLCKETPIIGHLPVIFQFPVEFIDCVLKKRGSDHF